MASPDGGLENRSRREFLRTSGVTLTSAAVGAVGVGLAITGVRKFSKQDSAHGNKEKGPGRIKSKEEESLATQIKFLDELNKNKDRFNKVLGGGRDALKTLLIEKFGKDPDSVDSLYDEELYPARQILIWYQHLDNLYQKEKDDPSQPTLRSELTLRKEINLQIVNLGNKLIPIKTERLKDGPAKLKQ